MTVAELKAKMAAALEKAASLEAAAKAANRDLTDDEAAQFDACLAEAEAHKDAIAKAEAGDARRDRLARIAAANKPQPRVRPEAPAAAAPVAQVKDLTQDDPKRGFKSPREFLMAVRAAHQDLGAPLDRRLASIQVDANGQILAAAGSDEHGIYSLPNGGFLVPAAFQPNLQKVGMEADPTIGRTTQVPMQSSTVSIPARTDKNHTTSVTGGLRFYRRAETESGTSSRMDMELITLRANSLMGVALATNELMQDSAITFAALIEAGFREEYGAFLLNEKIRGTGAGQYEGVLNSPAKVTVAKESGQAANTIVGDNITKMRARCWGYGSAIWLANIDTYPQLAKAYLAGGTGSDVFLFSPARGEDTPDMLLGRPIFFTEFAETLGTEGDLILGNWSQYLEGQYQGLQMAESVHVRFLNNENAFRFDARNDGRCWWRSALTPKKGANTLSPIVTLATRA